MHAAQNPRPPIGVNPPSTTDPASVNIQDHNQSYSTSRDAYKYDGTSYQDYSYGYPQQGNASQSQRMGGHPYQPANLFHNLNGYADSTTYQGAAAYYNAPGATYAITMYPQTGYGGQWVGGNYGNYGACPGYGTVNSGQAPTNQYTTDHQQHWANYHTSMSSAPVTDLDDCQAPGTETITSTPAAGSAMYSQPPPPGTQPQWDLNEKPYPEPTSSQASALAPNNISGTLLHSASVTGFHQEQYSQVRPLPFNQLNVLQQKTEEQVPQYQSPPQQQHMPLQYYQHIQAPNPSYKPGSFLPLKALQPTPVAEASPRRTNLQVFGTPRVGSAPSKPISIEYVHVQKSQKPAYVSVADKSPSLKSSTDAVTDAMPQPGMFPTSLRAYVERALSRCKDDAQKKACQEIMKEMITSASVNGSLFTKNWDTEPLFPLPIVPLTAVKGSNDGISKHEKSPTRRMKSRWEPLAEEKPEVTPNVQVDTNKGITWNLTRGETSVTLKWEKQDGLWNKSKLLFPQQFLDANEAKRAVKKARKDVVGEGQEGSSEGSEDEVLSGGGVHLGTLSGAERPEEALRRQSRTKRFDKNITGGGGDVMGNKGTVVPSVNSRRATALTLAKCYGDGLGRAVEDIDWDSLTVKGTCEDIEKRYLRLTSVPDPNTVRPEEVLQKALAMVQTTNKNYLYKCEQLKSIRQDLTVQRIRNELTVQVYETHARMALEGGDLPEYNQCQSQLKGLYAESILGCNNEFTAYSLLYNIFHHGNKRDLLSSMARLGIVAKQDEAVKHALAVRAAVAAGNYVAFFRLYRTAPNLGTCLMDLYIEKMRFEAMRCMARVYRPTLPVLFIGQTLGFVGLGAPEINSDTEVVEGLNECEDWLRAHGAVLVTEDGNGEQYMDCKASSTCLFMPEPEDAVAHGDVNLAVNDFLAQS